MRMDTDPGDVKMAAAAAAGRRLRTRPSKINCYADCDVIEEDGKACKRKRTKNRGCKRKAEVNIESLYRQENMKEVPSTPLETIYESPRCGRGRGMKGKSRKEDEMTSLSDMCDLNLPVMTKRKIKRLCLFTSHYYPSKQKTLLRRERARLMELKGVNIPDGATISFEDVDAVLSCLSNEDQDENNQNVMNNSSLSVNKSGFYVGNVIRPDIQDEVTVDDIIQNMGDLKMNTSKGSLGIHSAVDDTVISPMLIDELIPSLPFTDEPIESSSQNCRKKKSRRRSGRLSRCLLPPVVKISGNNSSGTYQIREQPCAPEEFTSLDNSIATTTLPGEELQNSLRHEKCESPTVMEEFSGISNPERKKPPAKKTLQVTVRRKSVNKRKKKDENINNQVDELRTVAENNAEQMRPSNEQVNGSESEIRMRKKRPSKSGVESDMKKRKDFKPDNSSEIGAKEPGELEMNVKSKRCKKQEKGNKGEKRRVSGIIRPLYSTMVELQSPDTPKTDELKESSFEFNNIVNDSVNTAEQKFSLDTTVIQEGALTFSPPTTSTSESNVCHYSPTSPSSQMAALNLYSDKSPVVSVNSCQSPLIHLKKNKKNGRRRSARLSTGSTAGERLVGRSSWGLGSYWSSWSPSTCITENVGTVDSTDVEGGYTSMQPSELLVHELQLIDKSNTERGQKEGVISGQCRQHLGFISQQDLIAVADKKSKATDMKSTYDSSDNTAGMTSDGDPLLRSESDSGITQGSQPGIKGDSICNVKECDNYLSSALAHNARNIGFTLQGTHGAKTGEERKQFIQAKSVWTREREARY